MFSKIILNIRRSETPFYALLYKIIHGLRHLNIPVYVLPLYKILNVERQFRILFLRQIMTFFYYSPLFRSRCKKVGNGFNYIKLQQGFPYLSGNIQIFLGENVTIHSRSSFTSSKVFDCPNLTVGDNTYLGPGLSISVAKQVLIGNNCHITSDVSIADNDGHPLDPICRAAHKPVEKESVRPVCIGDYVWIGEGAMILKGVHIGEASVIGARSVVSSDVEPYHVVAGNPAKFIKKINT